jgi:hypothetical protein
VDGANYAVNYDDGYGAESQMDMSDANDFSFEQYTDPQKGVQRVHGAVAGRSPSEDTPLRTSFPRPLH